MSLLFLIAAGLNLILSVLYALGLLGVGAVWSPVLCVINAISACAMFYLFGRCVAEERYAEKYRAMCREIDRARKYAEQVIEFLAENSKNEVDHGKTEK